MSAQPVRGILVREFRRTSWIALPPPDGKLFVVSDTAIKEIGGGLALRCDAGIEYVFLMPMEDAKGTPISIPTSFLARLHAHPVGGKQ